MKFIVPNNVEASYLYKKLEPNPACGIQMPANMGMLPAEEMMQLRAWIEAGAKND